MAALIAYLRDPKLVTKFQTLCGVRIVMPDQKDKDDKNYVYTGKFAKTGLYPIVYPSKEKQKKSKINSRVCHRRLPSLEAGSRSITSEDNTPPELVVRTFILLDLYFRFASELGYEPFYITVMPFFMWNVDAYVGRLVISLWCFSMYAGQAIKPLVRWPRPPSPPVIRLEKNPILEMEYGFPSTHATVCTTLPFYTLYLTYGRHELSFLPVLVLALVWCVSVSLSRIYVGVHSFMDLVGGIAVSVVIFLFSVSFLEAGDNLLIHSPIGPMIAGLMVISMLYIYPVEKHHWSMDRGDTAAILGVGLGVFTGCWLDIPLDDTLTGPFPVQLFSLQTVGMSLLRFVVGILIIVPVRFIMKTLCYLVLPAIMPTSGVEEVKKRPLVELPYKILTYTSIGFSVAYLTPQVFNLLNISRV